MSKIPPNLYYTMSHEWVKKEGDLLTIGITDHAQTMLGDLVYVELPELETDLEIEQECAVVESVKAAADVYCPVAGEVVEINSEIVKNPQLINQDPYEKGWLFKLRPYEVQLSGLLDANQYTKIIAAEAH